MTLILAMACQDGVVFASESASSDPDIGIKLPTHKIKQIPGQPILYGGSGDVGLLQKIDDALRAFQMKSSLRRLRQELRRLIVPEQKEACEVHSPYPQQGFHQPPVAILLFAGVSDGQSWIVEIERNGGDTSYGEELGNFAAVGSGKPWAQAVFRPHIHTPRDLALGKIFAYRVLDDSIDLAAAYLARPIHMLTISLDGTVGVVENTELESLAQTCEVWRTLERDAVGRLLAGQSTEEQNIEVPKPESA